MKIILCGDSRHGKDELAETLERLYGLPYESSSHFARHMVWDRSPIIRGKYRNPDHAWRHRHEDQPEWYMKIKQINSPPNWTRLARLIFKDSDVYCGMRGLAELRHCRREGLVDLVVWVDALQRIGTKEPKSSNTITAQHCDVTIDNNADLQTFHNKISLLFDPLLKE